VFLAALVFFVWSARRHPGREEQVLREGFEVEAAAVDEDRRSD
jgi:phosphatidylglycerol---prolipoprotein diacylglyceryl transferase